jgi:hypothetical protein
MDKRTQFVSAKIQDFTQKTKKPRLQMQHMKLQNKPKIDRHRLVVPDFDPESRLLCLWTLGSGLFVKTNPIFAFSIEKRISSIANMQNKPKSKPGGTFKRQLVGAFYKTNLPIGHRVVVRYLRTKTDILRNEPCAKRSWCNSAGITLPGQR